MSIRSLVCAFFLGTSLSVGLARADLPQRPRITGVSHAGFWVKDMDKTRAFYMGYLGFAEPFSLTNKEGVKTLTWMKVNDVQTVELFAINEKTPKTGDSLYHVALETDDAAGMLEYLKSKGVTGPGGKALPATVPKGRIKNLNYFIEDPDGHIVEIVQYAPDSWTVENKGKFLADTRVSTRISHAGISVGNLAATLKFYEGILGFQEFWRGSRDGKLLSWVNLRVPDGKDYLELMLYSGKPTVDSLHTMHHICLEVADISKVQEILKTRTLPEGCKQPTAIKTGVNGKRQINCFDPDGTRVEIMEAATADGKPVPPSTAPAPGEGQ